MIRAASVTPRVFVRLTTHANSFCAYIADAREEAAILVLVLAHPAATWSVWFAGPSVIWRHFPLAAGVATKPLARRTLRTS